MSRIYATEKETGYRCHECGDVHLEREDALECCHHVEEVDIFICQNCGKFYINKERADECCSKDEPEDDEDKEIA